MVSAKSARAWPMVRIHLPPLCSMAPNTCSTGPAPWQFYGCAAAGFRAVGGCGCLSVGYGSGSLELFFPLLAGVASIRIHFRTGIPVIQYNFKVPAVMDRGRVGHQPADQFVFAIWADRELEAIGAFAMLLRPGRIQIFLTAFRWAPAGRHGVFFDLFLVISGEMLPGCRHQRGINDLAAPGHMAVLQDLLLDCREQRLGTGYANMVFRAPDGRAIRKTCSTPRPQKR